MDRPVVCVHDTAVLDEVLRLAAAAGTEVERVADVAALRARWPVAPLVVLDGEAVARCRSAALPRREAVVLVATGPPPPALWEQAVGVGVARVVELPAGQTWLVGALADAADAPAGTAGRVLAVVGGRGGAGASTFAAALGLSALELGTGTLLVDCDPLGGGLDLVLSAEDQPGLRWPDVRLRSGRVPVSSLRSALPGHTRSGARLTLLSSARDGDGPAPEAVAAVVDAGRRGGETVVCDLPRAPDPAAHAALDRADLTVVIAPAELRAASATRRVVAHLADRGVRPGLVVRVPGPSALSPNAIAEAVGLPLLATVKTDPVLAHSIENGGFRLSGSIARAARVVLRALAHPPGSRIPRARPFLTRA
ncbi:septum site-determining protein Ssd [Actinokineospora spheciospongiae]|uniref:septum site-determining protein Ssd n=1 Tax=Actinokineospora spheciospongiae TaxID=909613 RepID=UPI000D70F783|nr:septum site-determining protein Ssd [Actinokineospora spheciospongiae]PWW65934.1 secretion/DNA translocation related CpaE-like protein [Actinokineospora spheciospongiae]